MTAPLLAPVGAPDTIAAVGSGAVVTYRELRERSRTLATSLLDAGMRPGDRVATVTANSVDHVVLFFACAEAGLVLVPLSWRASATELADMLRSAAPVLLAHDPEHRDQASRACSLLNRPPPTALLGSTGLEHAVPDVRPADEPAPDGAVLLLFTSGSSGRAKGVLLSQANCLATNGALDRRFPMTAQDTVLAVLPQFHVAGWNVQPLQGWSRGARVVLASSFDPGSVLETIEQQRVTMMMGVPTVYQMLAAHPDFPRRDLSSLHTAVVGGAPVDVSLGRAFARHRVTLAAGYGLTEAGPNVLCEPAGGAGSGWMAPYPGVEVRLDRTGQLLVKGPGIFAGYWRDETATAAVLRDGWLATGDIAEQAGERFRLRGRTSESYISGGENIHPAEVERALRMTPSVAEAAVIGVPDERWGEAGVAFVVPPAGRHPTPEQIRVQVRERLAGFKMPREIVVMEALPLTGTGKVDKRVLRRDHRRQEQR